MQQTKEKSMDIFAIDTIRQNIHRSNAEMYSIKENVKAAIVMSILGSALVVLCSYLYVGNESVTSETNLFVLFHLVFGIAALVFGIVMIVNCVIDFRSASRRMRIVSSDMYRFEQSIRKTA